MLGCWDSVFLAPEMSMWFKSKYKCLFIQRSKDWQWRWGVGVEDKKSES